MSMKLFYTLLLSASALLAYNDADMDGVEDAYDQCPNTSFAELVDIKGCPKSLQTPHHFDVIFGLNYASSNYGDTQKSDTYTGSLQLDYYYKNFSLQASTSYYEAQSTSYSDNGLNDSFLGASYKFEPTQKLSLRVGAGVILPSYDTELQNNNTDYMGSLNVSYELEGLNVFGAYSHTLIGDDDIPDLVLYQDTSAYSVGLGIYPNEKLYVSAAYNKGESIYKDVEDIETLSVYGFYAIDANYFTTLSYALGVSDSASDNSLSLRIGYYF